MNNVPIAGINSVVWTLFLTHAARITMIYAFIVLFIQIWIKYQTPRYKIKLVALMSIIRVHDTEVPECIIILRCDHNHIYNAISTAHFSLVARNPPQTPSYLSHPNLILPTNKPNANIAVISVSHFPNPTPLLPNHYFLVTQKTPDMRAVREAYTIIANHKYKERTLE